MRDLLEGSHAIAETVARCRPRVIPAYPITPQTHIVEALGVMVKSGSLAPCEFLTVESEFAAMSAAIGASAAGVRAYTATASQGLLYMTEALYSAAGLAMPVVMTVANRAIGAPINIWNDHSDSMSQRDCGWIQLYAEDNQAAVDLHVIAFRIAEALSVPAMVCMDGFVLTHAFEPLEVPEQNMVDRFLPPYRPRQYLDPDEPVTMGAMVGPDAFTEVRYLAHDALMQATSELVRACATWELLTGRGRSPVTTFRVDGAETVIVTLGSVAGTIRSVLEDIGEPTGLLTLTLYRPFPAELVRAAVGDARHVIVIERAFAPGAGGVVSADVRTALAGSPARIITVVAGLGGRPVTQASIRGLLHEAETGALPDFSFLDLHTDVVEGQVARHSRIGGGHG